MQVNKVHVVLAILLRCNALGKRLVDAVLEVQDRLVLVEREVSVLLNSRQQPLRHSRVISM